jgi:polysaccharide pyruvyl transferase CsaB
VKYLVSGYYGEKNAGDEAILAGILQEVGRRDPEAQFTVLSFDPDDTHRRHGQTRFLDVISTSLRNPGPLRAAMKRADLLISGGGSLLHEADFELHGRSFLFREGKLRPIPYFLSIVLMARAQGLAVMWYAQGLGPLHTLAARRLVARAASMSQAVTWRDPESARLAYDIGVRAPVQEVVPDPAYALVPASKTEVQAELARYGLNAKQPYIAVCPRPWLGRAGYLQSLGEALERAAAALELPVLLVPLHEHHDPEVCDAVAARPGFAGRARSLAPISSPSLLAGVLGGADLVVAMRLHAGILAARAGTPAVVLDYDPKTKAFAEQTGQGRWAVSVDLLENAVPGVRAAAGGPTTAGVDALTRAIVDTMRDLQQRRAALARAVMPLRQEAGRTAGLAVQLAATRGALAVPDPYASVLGRAGTLRGPTTSEER